MSRSLGWPHTSRMKAARVWVARGVVPLLGAGQSAPGRSRAPPAAPLRAHERKCSLSIRSLVPTRPRGPITPRGVLPSHLPWQVRLKEYESTQKDSSLPPPKSGACALETPGTSLAYRAEVTVEGAEAGHARIPTSPPRDCESSATHLDWPVYADAKAVSSKF